jgi:hypothetical protein
MTCGWLARWPTTSGQYVGVGGSQARLRSDTAGGDAGREDPTEAAEAARDVTAAEAAPSGRVAVASAPATHNAARVAIPARMMPPASGQTIGTDPNEQDRTPHCANMSKK